MKPNTLLAVCALCLAALYAPLAAAQQWGDTKRAPNVYTEGSENSVFFNAPTTISSSATITGVSWNIVRYLNGAPTQEFKICYAQPYTTTYGNCRDVSNELTGINVSQYNGLPAKGSCRITARLSGGGSYPAIPGPTETFTLQVNYQ
ncbi:MAG: hypothetical protein LBI31_02110 [Zoogloeaceae bacterium]|nr:hypothetical protein [Zoogloeaceae bacterium]